MADRRVLITSCPESGSAAAREIYGLEVTQVECESHHSLSFLDVAHRHTVLNAAEDRVAYKEGKAAFKIQHPYLQYSQYGVNVTSSGQKIEVQ